MKVHDRIDPFVGVLNGILAAEPFEDPLLTWHAFGRQKIDYVIAPLPEDNEECLSFGGFELGKFQTILTAITAGEVIPVVSAEDYDMFLECLAQTDPERHSQIIFDLKAKAAAKLAGILGVLQKLNAHAAALMSD